METYWLIGRADMDEVNDSMVCKWVPKKKKVKVRDSASTLNTSQRLSENKSSVGTAPSPIEIKEAAQESVQGAVSTEPKTIKILKEPLPEERPNMNNTLINIESVPTVTIHM